MAKARTASNKVIPTAINIAAQARPSTRANHKTSTKIAPPTTSAPISKAATVLSLLRRTGGVSIVDIQKSTDWQPHSVRGFLSGTVKKKMGLKLTSTKIKGVRTYRIAG